MHEALKKTISDRKTITDMEVQNKNNLAQYEANLITTAFNGASEIANKAIGTYAQSEMRKDAPALSKGLEQLADEYINVDDPESYQKFTDARKNYIDNYLQGKNALFRGIFNEQFRANYEDDAYSYFDKKFTTTISEKNIASSSKIMEDSVTSFVNGEDLSKYDNPVIYKTVVDSDGIHVVQEAVTLDNLWDTNTGDEKTDKWNHLLNIQYEAAALSGMTTDQAKTYVEEQIPSIESKVMLEELYSMTELYCNGIMVDGKMQYYTEEEAKELLYKQYGNNTPYTKRDLTAKEKESYKSIIDSVVDTYYKEKQDTNWNNIYTDKDGFMADSYENQLPLTTERWMAHLAESGIVVLNENGKMVSHPGLSDKDYSTLKSIMDCNDKVEFAELWSQKDKKVYKDENGDGLVDLTDVPDWALAMIRQNANGYYVDEDFYYKTLSGDAWFAESTKAHIYETINAYDAVKAIMEDAIQYEAYTSSGIAVPENNQIQGAINAEMESIYGSDWREQDIPVDDAARITAQISGKIVSEFNVNLANTGDDSLKQYYSESVTSYKRALALAASEQKTTLATETNAQNYKDIYGDGTGLRQVGKWIKPESDFGAIDYVRVDEAYKAGDTTFIDAMLINDGYSLVGKTNEELETLRRGKYDANENRIDLLMSSAYKYEDENGKQYAENATDAITRLRTEAGATMTSEQARTNLETKIGDKANYYEGFLQQLNVFKINPTVLGAEPLNNAEYECLTVSNINLAVALDAYDIEGLAKINTDGDDVLSIEEMEALLGEDNVKALKDSSKKADEPEEAYREALLINTNYILSNMYGAVSGDFGGDVQAEFNLRAVETVAKKAEAAYKDEVSAFKHHPAYDSTLSIKSWSEIVTESNYKTSTGTESQKYGIWKTASSVGDPFMAVMDNIKNGSTLAMERERVAASQMVSESDTDIIMNNLKLLEEIVNDPKLADNVSYFVQQLPSETIKEQAWEVILKAVANRPEGWTYNQVISQIEADFTSSFGSRLKDSFWTQDNLSEYMTGYVAVDFGEGNKLSTDTKGLMDGYMLDAANGRFELSGINALVNSYYNEKVMTGQRFDLEMKNMNGDELYNYAIICALEAHNMDTYGLDPRADNFTDVLESKFPSISKTSTGYDSILADHILRTAAEIMYVSEVKSPKHADMFGVPEQMDIAHGMYTTDALNKSKVNKDDMAQGAYLTDRSKNGIIAPTIVTNDGAGTTIDLYPFTEAGQKEWATKIVREMAEIISAGSDKYGGKNGYKDMLIAFDTLRNNHEMQTEFYQSGVDSFFAEILQQCPSYQQYQSLIKQASDYIHMDFPTFKPWNIGIKPMGEFYYEDTNSVDWRNVGSVVDQSRLFRSINQ